LQGKDNKNKQKNMKIRLCDKCKQKIEGKYIKCCESKMENKKLILTHLGDLCLTCWEKLNYKGISKGIKRCIEDKT